MCRRRGGGGGGVALQPDREPLQNPDGLRPCCVCMCVCGGGGGGCVRVCPIMYISLHHVQVLAFNTSTLETGRGYIEINVLGKL